LLEKENLRIKSNELLLREQEILRKENLSIDEKKTEILLKLRDKTRTDANRALEEYKNKFGKK
jgi:hypothetical protein